MALADEPRHGLGIVEEVAIRTEGAVKLGPGTLYGTIKKLREVKFIREAEEAPNPDENDTRRRYYALTTRGRESVREEARRMELLVRTARAKALLDPAEG